MTQHLQEAIEINQKRRPLYSKLSGGKSLKISNTLIFFEKLSLASSYPLDILAKYWQKRNVPVLEYEFIPMSETPDFKECFANQQGITQSFPDLKTQLIVKDCASLFKNSDYQGIVNYTDRVIKETEEYSKHMCMVRHILESIRRAAYLIERHIENSQKLQIRSPEFICRYLLKSQISIIHTSKLFDYWAHPLQKDGIPIIFQDVPFIPARPDNY